MGLLLIQCNRQDAFRPVDLSQEEVQKDFLRQWELLGALMEHNDAKQILKTSPTRNRAVLQNQIEGLLKGSAAPQVKALQEHLEFLEGKYGLTKLTKAEQSRISKEVTQLAFDRKMYWNPERWADIKKSEPHLD